MSGTVEDLVEQAHSLCRQARLLPADGRARLLEQVATIVQADTLATAERSGEIKDAGCRTVCSFATTILRRSVADATQVAQVALRLVDFPQLAAAYRRGLAHTGNLRAVVREVGRCALEVLQAHEEQLVLLATQAEPEEIRQFCAALAEANKPDRDKDKVTKSGGGWCASPASVIWPNLDAMLEPGWACSSRPP